MNVIARSTHAVIAYRPFQRMPPEGTQHYSKVLLEDAAYEVGTVYGSETSTFKKLLPRLERWCRSAEVGDVFEIVVDEIIVAIVVAV